MNYHLGTLFAGITYLVIGGAFLAEAVGWWSLQWADFRLLGPLALVVAGLAVIVGRQSSRQTQA